jgi:hypothetical protein
MDKPNGGTSTMGFNSALKRKEILSPAATRMNLEELC